jgi:voltage-gated potassium channel
MGKFKIKSIISWDVALMLSVFICAFIIPVFPPSWGRFPVKIGFTMIFIFSILSMDKRPHYMLYLSLAAFSMEWISGLLSWEGMQDISRGLNVLFFLFVMVSLFRQMVMPRVVSARLILSSISGYLLLGIIFSVLIAAIIQRDHEAFNIVLEDTGSQDATAHLSESMYFGFVTMGTLGYGDILPLKPYTRSLATFITVSGQLYIATIIGILIGKYASRKEED